MLESNTNPNFHNKNETPSCPEPSVPGRVNSSATIGLGSSQCIRSYFLAGVRDF